jgi:hypothetical protein
MVQRAKRTFVVDITGKGKGCGHAAVPGLDLGADARNRTEDPIITSDVLCQLSYVGSEEASGFYGTQSAHAKPALPVDRARCERAAPEPCRLPDPAFTDRS